jgi:16S rRNA (uracil1498-N3)-methyltransferase
MSLPFFYIENLADEILTLNEDTSKHIIGVLRMQKGEHILLTDGRGTKATAAILDDHRKRCIVQTISLEKEEQKTQKTIIAISLLKNVTRFEWFLEKATEIGVTEIIPLVCERTESEKFRHDRLNGILISAMLQSQQTWLPVLHHPTSVETVIKQAAQQSKFIAHCLPNEKAQLSTVNQHLSTLVLIGPEGDFTADEIEAAIEHDFKPVTLGGTRLRTETAGLVAATLLCHLGGDEIRL